MYSLGITLMNMIIFCQGFNSEQFKSLLELADSPL